MACNFMSYFCAAVTQEASFSPDKMYVVKTVWMMACFDPGCTRAKGRAGGLMLNRLERSRGSRVISVNARCCICYGQGWH